MASFLVAPAAATLLGNPKLTNTLDLARCVGLLAGCMAVTKSNYGYNVRLPCRQHRFCLRKFVFAFLTANPSWSNNNNNNNNNNVSNPPWCTTEHKGCAERHRQER